MRKNQDFTKATDGLCRRFDAWRKNHRPRAALPRELWEEAAALAGEQGIWKTARILRLDYTALKKRVEARTAERPAASPEPQFVELLAPLSGQIAECALEVESIRGARLRIEMKSVAAAGLASIIREFAG